MQIASEDFKSYPIRDETEVPAAHTAKMALQRADLWICFILIILLVVAIYFMSTIKKMICKGPKGTNLPQSEADSNEKKDQLYQSGVSIENDRDDRVALNKF